MLGKINDEQEPLRKVYLTIARGRVEQTLQDGRRECYGYVDGTLERVHSKDRNFHGESVKYWYLDVRDGAELYSLGFPLYSGTLRSIILSLASVEELSLATPVRIEPYERNGYTKVAVFADGVKLDWVTKELPPVEEVVVGGKRVKDESKRDAFIEQQIATIQERLNRK